MPTGLALDESRQILYLSDMQNHRVRAVNLRVGKTYQAEVSGQASLTDSSDYETRPLPLNLSKSIVFIRTL